MDQLDMQVRIGHVHLKVSNLDRSIQFYTKALGFSVTQRLGSQAAFLSIGDYHHEIGLNTWTSKDGKPPESHSTGLFHFAILYPTQLSLAIALKRLLDNGVVIDGAADHGVSDAIYFRDPDQNGVEIYWDKPQASWPRSSDGGIAMFTTELDLSEYLKLAET